MLTFRTTAEVKEDRRIDLTLPPETPLGKAELVVTLSPQREAPEKPPRTSLADWAEQHAEQWGDRLDSSDVAKFTGRDF
jgi:hypothetical protein